MILEKSLWPSQLSNSSKDEGHSKYKFSCAIYFRWDIENRHWFFFFYKVLSEAVMAVFTEEAGVDIDNFTSFCYPLHLHHTHFLSSRARCTLTNHISSFRDATWSRSQGNTQQLLALVLLILRIRVGVRKFSWIAYWSILSNSLPKPSLVSQTIFPCTHP